MARPCSNLVAVSHNDDFWSGSQQDQGEPTEQSPYFGDSVFDQPRQPAAHDPYGGGSHGGDPYGGDPYGQPQGGDPYGQPQGGDPYGQPQGGDPFAGYGDPYGGPQSEEARRRVLATGPHQLGDQWGDPHDPFQDPFDPNRGREDEFSARRGRGGFMVAFIGAAILVALAAGAYAVYTVLQDTNDVGDTAAIDDSTTTTTLLTTTTESTTTTTLPVGMQIQLVSDQFICNGAVQEFGLITGATPNEEVAFTSPQSPNLRAGQADENGRLPIRWSCTADQVGTVWELTATGSESALSATTSFTGVPEGTEIIEQATTTTVATTTTIELGEFTVVLTENPFTCDGGARVFGTLTGATPNGQISFSSPQTSGISPGTADETGSRSMRWTCSPDQADTVWELTATDDATGRSVTFKLSGQP